MKHFNYNTDDDDYDSCDDKIRGKLRDIRMMLSRLGNTVTNNDRRKIKRNFIKQIKRKTFQIRRKIKFMMILLNLQKILIKKEEYKYHDRDDLDYYGIRDIENLFDIDNDNANDYYKPILVKSSTTIKTTINIIGAEKIKTKNYQ